MRWYKVIFYLDGGNKVNLKCRCFVCNSLNGNRELTIQNANVDDWTFDLNKIQAIIVKRRWFFFLSAFTTK